MALVGRRDNRKLVEGFGRRLIERCRLALVNCKSLSSRCCEDDLIKHGIHLFDRLSLADIYWFPEIDRGRV